MNRYLIITNDTEALPNRATEDHVRRLMWGEHENGTAGVREMADIAREFHGKITFFVDICGALDRKDEVLEVARWLNDNGQDVELHLHPEYLPETFWKSRGLQNNPRWLNQYLESDRDRLRLLIKTFGGELERVLGRKLNAYRAGSFRWNSLTPEVLRECGIPLAFNNTRASVAEGQCPYAAGEQYPFRWSNGIIEVPVTERIFPPRSRHNWWIRYQYPLCSLVRYRTGLGSFIPCSISPRDEFVVLLMHSWSFLYRDSEGYEYYRDDQRLEGFRKLLRKMSRDFDIIDSRDLKSLIDSGKFEIRHTEDLSKAVYVPETLKFRNISRQKNLRFNSRILKNRNTPEKPHGIHAPGRFLGGLQNCLLPETLFKYLRSEHNTGLYHLSLTKKDGRTAVVIRNRSSNKIEKKQYIPLNIIHNVSDFRIGEYLPLYIAASGPREILAGLIFYDGQGQHIASSVQKCNSDIVARIPRNAALFSIMLRVPEDFRETELAFIALTPADPVSDFLFPITGASGNRDSRLSLTFPRASKFPEKPHPDATAPGDYLRLAVFRPENRKHGAVIVLPENGSLIRNRIADFPGYSRYLAEKLHDELTEYTVIYAAEPFPDRKNGYGGSWFFDRNGASVIPELAARIREILGEDCRNIVCAGHGMGATAALQLSLILKAGHCLCDFIQADLLKNANFAKLRGDILKLNGANPEEQASGETDPGDHDISKLHALMNLFPENCPRAIHFNFEGNNSAIADLGAEQEKLDIRIKKSCFMAVITKNVKDPVSDTPCTAIPVKEAASLLRMMLKGNYTNMLLSRQRNGT